MIKRRNFIQGGVATAAGVGLLGFGKARKSALPQQKPVVVSTWDFGQKANAEAWKVLSAGGRAVDAVEHGVRIIESDVNNLSVGIGGLPDRDGYVTLDACIMDEHGNAGSVCFLQHIEHPVSVARLVMDRTPHVMLAGEGALQFALESGFEKINLMTDQSKRAYEEWKKESKYAPIINIENHDTIGMLAIDNAGNLSGACTTSGLAYKMHGRVGDSPVLGAGLFIDNEIGGATATGMGEAVLKTCGSFLVVELMRQGRSPEEACKEAVLRIAKNQNYKDFQIGFLALNKNGQSGSFCIHPGFNYAYRDIKSDKLYHSKSYIKG